MNHLVHQNKSCVTGTVLVNGMPGHFTYIVIKKLCLWSVSSTICIDKRREKESNTSKDSLNQMCSDSTGSERLSRNAS